MKRLARTDPPDVIVFYMGVFVTPMLALPALAVRRRPSAGALIW